MQDEPPSEELLNLIDTLARQLSRHVVPIYRDDDRGRPEVFGSGLLLATHRGSFLVTAAHVLDQFKADKKPYFHLPWQKLWLAGRSMHTTPPSFPAACSAWCSRCGRASKPAVKHVPPRRAAAPYR
jgi:hypothetical protein